MNKLIPAILLALGTLKILILRLLRLQNFSQIPGTVGEVSGASSDIASKQEYNHTEIGLSVLTRLPAATGLLFHKYEVRTPSNRRNIPRNEESACSACTLR